MVFHLRGVNKKKKEAIKKMFIDFENSHPEMKDAFIEVCTDNAVLIRLLSDDIWPKYEDGSGIDILNIDNETWVFTIKREAIRDKLCPNAKTTIYHFLYQIYFSVQHKELIQKYKMFFNEKEYIIKKEGFSLNECTEIMWKEFSIFSCSDFYNLGYNSYNLKELIEEFIRVTMRDSQNPQAFDDMLVETSILLSICKLTQYDTNNIAGMFSGCYRKFFLRMRDVFF